MSIILIGILSTFFAFILKSDAEAKSILNSPLRDAGIVEKYLNGIPNSTPMENILLGVIQIESNCELSNKIINKLLIQNRRNQYAWFSKAICSNKSGDFNRAIKYMKKSLSFDPINANYLAVLSKLQIAGNKLEDARFTWRKLKNIYPNHPEIPIIDNSLLKFNY